MDFAITTHDGYLEITLTGMAELSGYATSLQALLEHPAWSPGTPVLMDQTAFDAGPLTIDEVQAIADLCETKRSEAGATRLAIVVARDLEYGMLRMWSAFARGRWEVETELFRSREEALGWLLAERTGTGTADGGRR